jgi:uncharacterized protein (TIGR04255 family)
MTTLTDPPLIEAIFQLRWGEVSPGQFSYSQDEQTLFAGKISAAAATNGFSAIQSVQQNVPLKLPLMVTHRFRKQDNTWPCYQVGLGIFTVNQTKEGYDWPSFMEAIKTGIHIFEQAEQGKLHAVKNSLSMQLLYQDAFFPESSISIEQYLKDHFKINAGLPDVFLNSADIDRTKSAINIRINVDTTNPKGVVTITVANAIINDQPGLLMETIVTSSIKNDLDGKVDTDIILNWAQQAHEIQKHSFKTLINPSAYQ